MNIQLTGELHMRRHKRAAVSSVLALALLAPAIASSDTLKLFCAYSQSVDEFGKTSPTTGGEHDYFTVEHSGVGKAVIKRAPPHIDFEESAYEGAISEEAIQGGASAGFFLINRFTGSIIMTMPAASPAGSWLLFLGRCRKADEKLF